MFDTQPTILRKIKSFKIKKLWFGFKNTKKIICFFEIINASLFTYQFNFDKNNAYYFTLKNKYYEKLPDRFICNFIACQ